MGIPVLPPDVNSSDWSFTPDLTGRTAGPSASAWARSRISATPRSRRSQRARGEVGRFRSLYQFCEKVDLSAVNRRMLESLIKAGAMDSPGRDAGPVVRGRRTARWSPASGRSATARAARPACSRSLRPKRRARRNRCPRRRTGARTRNWPAKKRCSDST